MSLHICRIAGSWYLLLLLSLLGLLNRVKRLRDLAKDVIDLLALRLWWLLAISTGIIREIIMAL